VCVFIAPRNVGDRFTSWSLHITVVPWFRLDATSAQITSELREGLPASGSFWVVIAGEATFGRNKLVNLVQPPTPLQQVEQSVRHYLHRKQAWLVDESTRVQRGYRPHVTAQDSERVHDGETYYCSKLSLVEQKGTYKQIVAEIAL
jgi:2'-5' RNA ligase